MAATQMTQVPQATYTLLHNLGPAHERVFPGIGAVAAAASSSSSTNNSPNANAAAIRPVSSDDDSPALQQELEEKSTMLRVVVGGWMELLSTEEAANGAHVCESDRSELVAGLSGCISGPLLYITTRPQVLLFRSTVAEQGLAATTEHGVQQGSTAANSTADDLATVFLPLILRNASSLEAALLSTPAPSDTQVLQNAQSRMRTERKRLLNQLEELLVTVIRALAGSAIRVEWHGRDSTVQGGLGKAREMVNELTRLLKAVTPSAHLTAPTFPYTHQFSDSSASSRTRIRAQAADGAGLTSRTASLVVRSPLHARALVLTTMRILHQAISSSSPFLSDLAPPVFDLLADSWPAASTSSAPGHSHSDPKGKSKVHQAVIDNSSRSPASTRHFTSQRITASSLDLALAFLQRPLAQAFEHHALLRVLLPRVACGELQNQLAAWRAREGATGDEAEDGEEGAELARRIGASLARVWAFVWRAAIKSATGGSGPGSEGLVASVALEVLRSGEAMLDCLISRTEVEDPTRHAEMLKLACLFALSTPFVSSPNASSAGPSAASETPATAVATDLLPPTAWKALHDYSSRHASLPIAFSGTKIAHLRRAAESAWKRLVLDLDNKSAAATFNGDVSMSVTNGNDGAGRVQDDGSSFSRKRKRTNDDLDQHPSSDVVMGDGANMPLSTATAGARRRKQPWRQAVVKVLEMSSTGEKLDLETEGVERMVARLAQTVTTGEQTSDSRRAAIKTFRLLSLLPCARDGSLVFSPPSNDITAEPEPNCCFCDAWTSGVTASTPRDVRGGQRTFTDAPLNAFRSVAAKILLDESRRKDAAKGQHRGKGKEKETNQDRAEDHEERELRARLLAFLRALPRLLRHSRAEASALLFATDSDDPIMRLVWSEMSSSSRPARLAAGNVLLGIAQAHQEYDTSATFVADLFRQLDLYLKPDKPAVAETTLNLLTGLARMSTPQGLLECSCLERLVSRLGHPNIFLKSAARTHLEQIAAYREIKTYALVQPHFATIAPLFISSKSIAPATLHAVLDCFHQSHESLLRITREYTLPSIVANEQRQILEQVAEASGQSVPVLLTQASAAAAVLAHLYMLPDIETNRGLKFFMREINSAGAKFELADVLNSIKIPLVYKLSLELGDQDPVVAAQAERALTNVERTSAGLTRKSKVELGTILKNCIVGMLSHMNRGLNESTMHRPLRDKQRIIRSLEAVTVRVGPAIAGFSPQIMATLQSALELPGLRGVTVNAFKSFIESLKFAEIGQYIGPTTATFVRLWDDFTPAEKTTATETIDYIVLQSSDGLAKFVGDIADIGGIPELARAHARLKTIRKTWTFSQRIQHLLARVASENDVVTLQALKELKALMVSKTKHLTNLSSGDTFSKMVGTIVKVLFSAAVRDGPDSSQIRNLAFECIGILGAPDPDRFELPPADSPTIVLENFEDREESVSFALRLIQDLLIGAYRSTNDTKHQEFLAFTIQELLRFCGFTAELVLPPSSSLAEPVNDATRARWEALPKSVLETCGPLLGTKFTFKNSMPRDAEYPIYSSTSSYRDWIRIFANDLIQKLEGNNVKRIFSAFPPVLHLEDIAVAQHLLPHLVLNALISGNEDGRTRIKIELETVLTDQVSPTQQLSEHSRLLTAQTVFDLMDHLSRWITLARKRQHELRARAKAAGGDKRKRTTDQEKAFEEALLNVEGILQDIPHILVGQAALTCKAYARSLLNFESHIVAQRAQKDEANDQKLQEYYENLHECYANLEEPDGMEGISTKIIAPSVLHQIREHESTGRWTSAQSCWEVKLQQKPDEPSNHIGLLRCLRNLGHYDSMRTHIVGILHSRGDATDWDRILAPYNIEASLFVGDWDAVEDALRIPDIDGPEVAFGRAISAMKDGNAESLTKAFFDAREQLGRPIVAAGRESYRRVYDSVVHLHIVQELEAIYHARETGGDVSPALISFLRARVSATSPSFRAREPILNMRRTALRLGPTEAARAEIAELWLETSKIARKAGHMQTAYSAILQARDLHAEFVFLQSAKLLKATDQPYKAIQDIDNALKIKIPSNFMLDTFKDSGIHPIITPEGPPGPLAKASLRRTRWMLEAGRLESTEVAPAFAEATKLAPKWESPYYYLGRYHDACAEERLAKIKGAKKDPAASSEPALRVETIKCFSQALLHGVKYIYQALPRMLTIWLEFGENPILVDIMRQKKKQPNLNLTGKNYELYHTLERILTLISRCIKRMPSYQWLTVLPQLVSRILHPNDRVLDGLERILTNILIFYPHQGIWAMASGAKSNGKLRSKRNIRVMERAKASNQAEAGAVNISKLIDEGLRLVDQLLALCDLRLTSNSSHISLSKTIPLLAKAVPTSLIIPLQSSLTVTLPSDASQVATHKPFPDQLVMFQSFEDAIQIMQSLQKPRKITVNGDDGKQYSFLCKPKDDLRKDARMMEFDSIIVKLLKKDSDARSRRLNIRTYAVVPLNEENGLIEWVPHTIIIRSILNKSYAARGILPWTPDLRNIFETIRDDPKTTGHRYTHEVLPKFPPVFHEWFLETFPEPSAWLRARLAYARTNAVMCMVGFMLGLGDRHTENILLDATTGDTVHVDFNCLFDRGRTFEVAEQVPFRLTHNIVDGMGVMGVEGVYRRAAEITLRILRNNTDSLMSVLETFLHDPLVDWVPAIRRGKEPPAEETADHVKSKARDSLGPISNKLRGLQVTSAPTSLGAKEVSVGEQVERLIREARDPKNLGMMYPGWAAWF